MKPFKINGFSSKFAVIQTLPLQFEDALNRWLTNHDMDIIHEIKTMVRDNGNIMAIILYSENNEP